MKTVVLVGHCGPDAFMLKHAVARLVPDAPIASADSLAALESHLDSGHVLLINRVPDGSFDGASGIDLVRRIAGTENPPIAMLISNHADAQDEAEAAGAARGFGKAELYESATADRLRQACGGGE